MSKENPPIKQSLLGVANAREFIDGSVRTHALLRNAVVALGTYQPGWRWSVHAGPQTGKPPENHIGYILSGQMRVEGFHGAQLVVGPGDAFELAAGTDAWVEGDEPCVQVDFLSLRAHDEIDK